MNDTYTQNMAIRESLMSGHVISQVAAYKAFGCTRLSARIWDLKHIYGLPISKMKMVSFGPYKKKYYAGYYIKPEDIERIKAQEERKDA